MRTGAAKRSLRGVAVVVGMVVSTFTVTAKAELLSFDGDICEPGGVSTCVAGANIGAGYGSIAGQIDIQLTSRSASGDGPVVNEHLRFWSGGFGDLVNVGYAALAGGGPTQVAEIAFRPLPGYSVTLISFDLAPWGTNVTSQYAVYDPAYNLLAGEGQFGLNDGEHRTIPVGITRSDGVLLQWGPDSFNAGIDNVRFSVSPVPEPNRYALIAAGLVSIVGIGALRRRR